jgi:myo-inositol-1(or 4)-monophosphatase
MNRETESYLESAMSAARLAGADIRQAFGRPVHTEFKSPTDPVTEVDRRCEVMIRDALSSAHPEIGFWGEEFGRRRDEGPSYWLVDPLDGTKNFVHGYPFVAVSIALVQNDTITLGVVYDPLRDEMFHGVRGSGAFLNERRLEVSQARKLEEAIVVTGFTAHPPQQKELIWKACQNCQGIRRGGASALDLCQLAAGRLDAMWEWKLRPWDLAAGVLLVQEAKGTVSSIDGTPFDLFAGQLLATNTNLHRLFIQMLS